MARRQVTLNALPPGDRRSTADQLPERGLVADRIEVGVGAGERAQPLAVPLRAVEREPEVLDRVGRPPREALAAREVVERLRIPAGFDQLASAGNNLRVRARLIDRVKRPPDLPADGFVCLPGDAADCDDRRPRLLGERGPPDAGRDEHERAGRRVHVVAVELEPCAAAMDEVELLVGVIFHVISAKMTGLAFSLVVLVDDPVTHVAARPCACAKRRDAEVLAYRSPGTAAVARLLDLVEVRDRVATHQVPPLGRCVDRHRGEPYRGAGTAQLVERQLLLPQLPAWTQCRRAASDSPARDRLRGERGGWVCPPGLRRPPPRRAAGPRTAAAGRP